MVQQRIAGTDGKRGKGFSLRKLSRVALGNRQYAGELWRDQLVALCNQSPSAQVQAACPVLAGWSGRNDLDAPGAVLFQRFTERLLDNFQSVPTGVSSSQATGDASIYDNGFDVTDPVNTPNGLNTENPAVAAALEGAVSDLAGAGIPVDGTLREFQYDVRAGKRIPIHGGPGTLGIFNAINSTWSPDAGYSNVPHGSSFIAAMGFFGKKAECPVRSLTFVTYGQSENERSPHAGDYAKAFSRKRWNRVPFCADQVRRKTLDIERVTARR